MTITAPAIGTRVNGLLNREGRGTCLSFGSVIGYTYAENSRTPNGIEVRHDGGELDSYRLSTYGDYWDRVSDHHPSPIDVQRVRDEGWQSRFGTFPIRATVAEAVIDSRTWWEAQAAPR